MLGKISGGEAGTARAGLVEEPATALEEIMMGVMHVQERLAAIIGEARGIANRTFGEYEQPADNEAARRPQASGAIGALTAQVETLADLADELSREVSRLRRL